MKNRMKVTDRPNLYDWLYGDFTDDIPMYCSLAKSHAVVLECGIGTGRIAIPLAENGKIVHGIDNSYNMLRWLENKLGRYPKAIQDRIYIHQADIRDFDLGRKFSLVLVPFSAFNYLPSAEEQKASLRSIRRHIAEQGTLVLELLSFSLYPSWFENEPILRKVKERIDPETGKTIELWKVAGFDSATQIITENRHFKFYDATGSFEREEVIFWENRFFFLGEIQLLLEATGFEIAAVYGDFAFGPYQHSSQIAVVVASLAEE